MPTWLWDFDARELSEAERTDDSPHARIRRGFSGTLFKTDAFLEAHPFGTVSAAFSGDGIFESNSILRAVVRAATDDEGLYGKDAFEASRIDSFLDAARLRPRGAGLSAGRERDGRHHCRAHGRRLRVLPERHRGRARDSPFIAGNALSIADIGIACDLAVPARATHGRSSRRERLRADQRRSRKATRARRHISPRSPRPCSRSTGEVLRQTLGKTADG